MCQHDVFARFFYFACHDTVSYYDIIFTSLFTNCHAILDFYLGGMHDTNYDTPIVTNLNLVYCNNCALMYATKKKIHTQIKTFFLTIR
jgi:hypothetical protein